MAGFLRRLLGIDTFDAAQRVLRGPEPTWWGTGGVPVMDPGTPLEMMLWHRSDVMAMWRSQPELRKVVGFIARNTASIPLHVFERRGDTDRARVTDHALARALRGPSPSPYRFWESVLSDGLLYDKWAILKHRTEGEVELIQLPAWRLNFATNEVRRVTEVRFWTGDFASISDEDDGWVSIPLADLIIDYGYSPTSAGLSPVETLRPLLDETARSLEYRDQVWANAVASPAIVTRPIDAPRWSDEQRGRFVNGLRAYRNSGSKAGGWPLFEDGMTVQELRPMKSSDVLDLDGRTLTAAEVASAFHVPPELVGVRAGNYSSMRELRQQLYRDVLGPYIDAWVQALNGQLVPDLGGGRDLYVEPHMEAKLRGSFEEQMEIAQASVGAPTMTRNEHRARMNMPPIAGGDELVTPLNVLVGGQASPRDADSTKPYKAEGMKVKAAPSESEKFLSKNILETFFSRQFSTILSRLGASADWWDGERWNAELKADIQRLYLMLATDAGRRTLERAGIAPEEFDQSRIEAYLDEAARVSAEQMNDATYQQVNADPENAAQSLGAPGVRAETAATTVAAFAASFGTVEAARQQGSRSLKTWQTNSRHPRSSHARMDGQTVPVDEPFSNGLMWPGAFGDPDETANCRCSVSVTIQ